MKKGLLLLGMMLYLASGIMAQDEVKPSKYENVTWHRVVLIDFKPGKVARAKEIIKIYQTAGASAGTRGPVEYWFETGEYDLMAIWTLEDGPSDLEWDISPDGIKWRAALVKQLGSEEAVQKLQQEFQSLRASSTSYIARKVNK